MAISAIPILPVESISGNQFRAMRLIEELTQTFQAGTPVSIAAGDGGVQAWSPNTGATGVNLGQGGVCGISYEAASNLTATGAGAPTPLSPLVGVGAVLGTIKNVPNQSAATTIFHGAPINDGRVGFILPTADTIFSAILGNNGNPVTPANTDVGKNYGLTLDSNSKYWYVDRNKSTVGTNVVLTVIALDLRDIPASGTRVLFQFISNYVNLLG
jgi:hypothetical protein